MINSTYCELKPLDSYYNNKPLYKCDYCGLTVGLENPETQILCFKKMEEIAGLIHSVHTNQNKNDIFHINETESLKGSILEKIEQDSTTKTSPSNSNIENENNICSQEQIEQRLSICKECEYYKNDSCLLCGCVVVRDSNYQNKLAHKDQKCPADKWGVVVD
jgi:hypothetical protein